MDLQLQSIDKITVIKISGRVDTYTVPALREQLNNANSNKPTFLLIDLTDVNFVDSSGLATFVQGMRFCRENGGDLCLCSPQQSVRMIFELTRLDKAIDIYSNEAEAIAALTH